MPGLTLTLDRADQDVSVATFHPRARFDRSKWSQILGEPEQQLLAQIRMRDLASAELDHRLHAIAFREESHRVILLEFVIVVVGVRPELQLLDLHHMLLLLGLVLLLFELVLIVAVVDRLGDRRNRRGSNQNQVETQILRLAQRGRGGHDLVCRLLLEKKKKKDNNKVRDNIDTSDLQSNKLTAQP